MKNGEYYVSQLAAAGISDKRPTLVQKVRNDGDWWIQNLISDHPESDILMHPVWCLSDEAIVGFDKFIYKWDLGLASHEASYSYKIQRKTAFSNKLFYVRRVFIMRLVNDFYIDSTFVIKLKLK